MECRAENITLQKHSIQYPVLAQMARDYLPIQGSATPSERAFSSASLTDSKQRNRLAPDTFKALQVLKSAYRHGHISARNPSILGGQDSDADDIATSLFESTLYYGTL